MPDISVLLCAYKEPHDQFDLALRSIALQTLVPKQIIIIDDSGDSRFEQQSQLLKESLPKEHKIQIVYIANKCNEGLVASLNKGIQEVDAEYVARMDADDISLPYRFQKQAEILNMGYDIVGAGITLFDAAGHIQDICYPSSRISVLYSLIRNNPIAHPVAMMKMGVLKRLKGYRQIDYAEDLDLWMRAHMFGYKITNSQSILLLRRMHREQLSSKYAHEQVNSTKILRRNFLKQLFNF